MKTTTNHLLEDDYLLKSIKMDDKKSFNILFLKYNSILCAYITPYVGEDNAEEIIQDIMVNIWENRKNLNIESSFKSYIFKSAKNRSLNLLEKSSIHESINSIIAESNSIKVEEPDYYIIGELNRKLKSAITKLPITYREALVQNRFKKKTYAEIAYEKGVSVKTIDYRIQKALKFLKEELKDYL